MEPKMGKLSDNYLIGVMNLPYFARPEEVEAMASELLQLREQTRWVPVSEKLPNTIDGRAYVIAFAEHMGVFPAEFVTDTAYLNRTDPIWIDSNFEGEVSNVTHWRPLPAPPEVE